ncbi:MAG: glycosyltransferase family 2 protein, partial [Thiotrichaceae bacterium]|nr:glycosyltransferase family 2 protein [Thiotrichaceae bacterium]
MSEKRPRVAILLAAYNGMAFIALQLQSILHQQGVDLRIFISVDLSTDDTYNWCCHFANNQPKVTVLPYGERFGGAAVNFYRLIK